MKRNLRHVFGKSALIALLILPQHPSLAKVEDGSHNLAKELAAITAVSRDKAVPKTDYKEFADYLKNFSGGDFRVDVIRHEKSTPKSGSDVGTILVDARDRSALIELANSVDGFTTAMNACLAPLKQVNEADKAFLDLLNLCIVKGIKAPVQDISGKVKVMETDLDQCRGELTAVVAARALKHGENAWFKKISQQIDSAFSALEVQHGSHKIEFKADKDAKSAITRTGEEGKEDVNENLEIAKASDAAYNKAKDSVCDPKEAVQPSPSPSQVAYRGSDANASASPSPAPSVSPSPSPSTEPKPNAEVSPAPRPDPNAVAKNQGAQYPQPPFGNVVPNQNSNPTPPPRDLVDRRGSGDGLSAFERYMLAKAMEPTPQQPLPQQQGGAATPASNTNPLGNLGNLGNMMRPPMGGPMGMDPSMMGGQPNQIPGPQVAMQQPPVASPAPSSNIDQAALQKTVDNAVRGVTDKLGNSLIGDAGASSRANAMNKLAQMFGMNGMGMNGMGNMMGNGMYGMGNQFGGMMGNQFPGYGGMGQPGYGQQPGMGTVGSVLASAASGFGGRTRLSGGSARRRLGLGGTQLSGIVPFNGNANQLNLMNGAGQVAPRSLPPGVPANGGGVVRPTGADIM